MLRSTADPPLPPLQSARLLDQVHERIRYLHYSIRTEQAYVHWVRAFVRHHHMRHPREMGHAEVQAFLSWLAADRQVAVSTHRQALREQLARARVLWAADAQSGHGGVFMPDALDRKYPKAGAQWVWFWVFPQAGLSIDPRSGVQRRHQPA